MAENVTRIKTTNDTISRISVLESQVLTVNHNIEKLETKVEGQYNALHSRISDMRDDVQKEIADKHTAIVDKLDQQSVNSAAQHKEISAKVAEQEKWRYLLIGGAAVIGYILAHIKIERLF